MPALPGELVIACGSGALQVLTLQRPGSRRVCTPEFLRGAPIQAGSTLDP
jgi:methionyl-tRNA formyltransferase